MFNEVRKPHNETVYTPFCTNTATSPEMYHLNGCYLLACLHSPKLFAINISRIVKGRSFNMVSVRTHMASINSLVGYPPPHPSHIPSSTPFNCLDTSPPHLVRQRSQIIPLLTHWVPQYSSPSHQSRRSLPRKPSFSAIF